MAKAIEQRCLVLNKHWQAINIVTVLTAICKVYQAKANIIGPDYSQYDFEAWVRNWEDAAKLAKVDDERIISCVRFQLVVPEIIQLKDYAGYPLNKAVKFSRRNVFERDDYTCQYCGTRKGPRDLNIDHVVPRSRGGKMIWNNVVLSCIPCNHRKRDRTPAEAHMRLLRQPFEPNWSQLKRRFATKVPAIWQDFLGTMYWDIGLVEDDD